MGTFYRISDQPTTCPKCSCRTEMLVDFIYLDLGTQLHRCNNEHWRFYFH